MLEELARPVRRIAWQTSAAGNFVLEPDDLYQEGMLAAWQSIEAGKGVYPAHQLRLQALQRSRYAMLNYARKEAASKVKTPAWLAVRRPVRGMDLDDVVDDGAVGPEEVVATRLAARALREAAARLPRRLRQVMTLLMDDRMLHELAAELGMSKQLFAHHRREAIHRLRLELEGASS